ncbi:hypothetical protein Q9K02_04565 [Qipengyuania sp. G39]|uniref:Uncharacterized protein n=1 Tax=Qipengyuania profundimaris TaxID=3067652 RepID=A0ABT9HMP5_9SPHN|nr:hypothetical protein [Qipengyuania sp. G39]MDP4574410.1 hypothetical protein [Qipengyuania sp. G39]
MLFFFRVVKKGMLGEPQTPSPNFGHLEAALESAKHEPTGYNPATFMLKKLGEDPSRNRASH